MSREEDYDYLRQAIAESRKSPPSESAYRVGAVIVTPGSEIFKGYTHETSPSNHAEEEAVLKAEAAGANLSGATIYSSMEPCSTRRSKPASCSELIIAKGFSRVVYALAEPPCFADCRGDGILRAAGIEVTVIGELAEEAAAVNSHILTR